MEFIFLNSSDLLSIYVADFNTRDKLLSEIPLKQGYKINFVKLFLNCIADTMILYLNSTLDLNLSCVRDFRNWNFMLN